MPSTNVTKIGQMSNPGFSIDSSTEFKKLACNLLALLQNILPVFQNKSQLFKSKINKSNQYILSLSNTTLKTSLHTISFSHKKKNAD